MSRKGSLHSIFFNFKIPGPTVVLCWIIQVFVLSFAIQNFSSCLVPTAVLKGAKLDPLEHTVDRPTPLFPPSGPNWFPPPSLAPCIWRLCFLNVSQWRENNAINLLKGKKHVNALAGTKKVQDLKYCSLHCFLRSLHPTGLLEQLIHEQPLKLWGLMLLWLFNLLDEV